MWSCFSKTLYKGGNAVERMFCRLKDYRRIATRCHKLAVNFLGAIYLAALSRGGYEPRLWRLRHFSPTGPIGKRSWPLQSTPRSN